MSKNRYEFKVKTRKLQKSRERARVKVAIEFSVVSDWLRKEREFSGPITERGEANLGLFSNERPSFVFDKNIQLSLHLQGCLRKFKRLN